jgi:UDP-glucose 4-epimerase
MDTILITGCAGFIGSALVRKFLDAGVRVIGVDNLSRGTRDALPAVADDRNFTFVEGDIRSAADVQRAFELRPRRVAHLAARHFIPECAADPAGTYAINVVGTENVWSAAVQHQVERFLFISTGDVYTPSSTPHLETDSTEPFNVYGLSKLTSEKSLAISSAASIQPTIARMFNVYGPGDRNEHLIPAVVRQVQAGVRRIELGNLWPIRDYIYVDDAAEALKRLLDAAHPPRVVNVGTGGGWSVEQVVQAIGRSAGAALTPVSVPRLQRPVERDTLRPDIGRLVAATGWRPARALEDGLREFVALAAA